MSAFTCIGCKEKFSSLTNFEAHRVGDHAISIGENRRRCKTTEEIMRSGYLLKNGIWRKRLTENDIYKLSLLNKARKILPATTA